MEKIEPQGRFPRRNFLAGFFATLAGLTAVLLLPKRARAEAKKPITPDTGPILYRRTEEAERYYRTLYR